MDKEKKEKVEGSKKYKVSTRINGEHITVEVEAKSAKEALVKAKATK